jgi:hypothetical protein
MHVGAPSDLLAGVKNAKLKPAAQREEPKVKAKPDYQEELKEALRKKFSISSENKDDDDDVQDDDNDAWNS